MVSLWSWDWGAGIEARDSRGSGGGGFSENAVQPQHTQRSCGPREITYLWAGGKKN